MYLLFPLFGAIFVAILGLFVYLRNRRSSLYITFALFCLTITIWLAATFGMFLSKSNNAAIFWDRIVYLGVVFIPTFMYQFSIIFSRAKRQEKFLFLSYALSVIFFILSRTDYFVSGLFKYKWGVHTKAQIFHHIFLIFFFSYITLFFVNVYKFYRRTKGVEKEQAKYLLLAFVILASIGPLAYLPAYGIEIYPFAYLSPVIFTAILAYAIVKHRLMDIRLVVARSVVYSLLVLIIASIYISIIFFIKQGYQGILHINPDLLFIIAGFAVAFGFQPLRRFLQKHTDRIFFKEMYDPQELLGNLSKIMSSTLRLDDLLNSMLRVIVTEIKINKAAFVLTSNGDITHVNTIGYGRISNSSWRKVASLIKDEEIIVADELSEESKEKDILRELEIAVLVPLQAEDNPIGLLALGGKRSGDMFTIQDLRFLGVLAPETAIAIQNTKLFEEKEKRILELGALNKIALSLSAKLDVNPILNQAIDQALLVTKADSGSIMLLDEETQTLTIEAARGIEPEFQRKTRLKVGQGIAGWVAKVSKPLIIADTESGRFKELLRRGEIVSALSVPLKTKEKVIGVLSVNRKTSKEPFTKENLNLISSFAAQVAIAIENARLYKDLEATFLGAISALAAAVEAKDHYTFGHSQIVTKYAVAIAKELSLTESEIESIQIASMLHDIGKIGLDGTILNKPGKLTSEERAEINLHPLIGVNILKSLKFLKGAIPLILYHHEHFDGKGYPQGLSGEAIPLGARIIAVADAFNAMISERPYRPAMTIGEATEELRNYSGTQFDSTIVEAFLRILWRESRKPLKVQQS